MAGLKTSKNLGSNVLSTRHRKSFAGFGSVCSPRKRRLSLAVDCNPRSARYGAFGRLRDEEMGANFPAFKHRATVKRRAAAKRFTLNLNVFMADCTKGLTLYLV